MFKKALCVLSLSLASGITFAGQPPNYMIVQCNMNPSTALTLPASYSDPGSGTMMIASTCGEALSKVPYYFVLSGHDGAGSSSAAYVNYLFVNIYASKTTKATKA